MDHPNKEQPTDMTMLRAAVRTWQGFSKSWEQYCAGQGEPVVRPVLVVQVQDGSGKQISKTDIAEAISVVHAEAADMTNEALAHSFQEGARLKIGDRELRYLAPSNVQEDAEVRVIFIK